MHHIKVATASPQANGQVERVNRTLLPMLAKLTDERSTHWSNVLPDVKYACNNVIFKVTNKCPSMLLFGVQQRGRIMDELRDALESSSRLNPFTPCDDFYVARSFGPQNIPLGR